MNALSLTDRIDKNYGLATSIAFVVGLAMLGISQLNSVGSSPIRSMADATAAIAEDTAKGAAAKAEASAIDHEKRDYIAKNLEVYELDARYMDSLLDGRIPGVTFKVRNNGQRTLDKVEVTVEFLDAGGKAISEEIYNPVIAGGYDSQPPLRPGHIWQNERGRFLAAKSVPSEWQSGRARARVTDITFAEASSAEGGPPAVSSPSVPPKAQNPKRFPYVTADGVDIANEEDERNWKKYGTTDPNGGE